MRSGSQRRPAGKRSGPLTGLLVVLLVGLGLGGGIGPAGPAAASAGGQALTTGVPAPATEERAGTVPILHAAFTSQGICYGWRLRDTYDVVSVGSNLGDGTAVKDAPECPRWIEVDADVTYTPESSEASDSAIVQAAGSADIDPADLADIERGLERFGLDEATFVDDPGWAVTRAATMLPLLAVEAGLAAPAAAPSVDPTASASPLPDAGSDFWRDRWGWLVAAVGLLLLATLFIAAGAVQRRREHRVTVPAQRAGTHTGTDHPAATEAAGRTREKE
ncbi:hypothetical protein ACL02O_18140 [Micromonospora sp. MS34]|uniref:hypothetical protein n=1 Tax=Micromonospora sp. MS34 TaxID=3385971 RepID=UPI0039A215AA